jgi:hypothetical protein
MNFCRHCGDPNHDVIDCPQRSNIVPVCPVCGCGTYVHRDGSLACVSPFCSWAGPVVPASPVI